MQIWGRAYQGATRDVRRGPGSLRSAVVWAAWQVKTVLEKCVSRARGRGRRRQLAAASVNRRESHGESRRDFRDLEEWRTRARYGNCTAFVTEKNCNHSTSVRYGNCTGFSTEKN